MSWEFGPYRVEELIARGGMGEVLRAHDTRHDRTVALKVLSPEYVTDHGFRERFKREAQAVAKLTEPHVVPIHAYGEIDGRLYLDMRLIRGEDLGARLARQGPMDAKEAVGVIGQIAQALDAAHAEGITHRDVKPSNIIIAENGFAYLVDFGIAHSAGASTTLTTAGTTLGTLDYMAPERFDAQPNGHRGDVYSLACVLYQCLTGSKPFAADTAASVINAHLNHVPPRPSARPGVTESLDTVVVRGMAKNPDERFTTAGAFATAVTSAVLAPIPGADSRTAIVADGSRQPRWWPVAVGLVAVLVVAGVAAVAFVPGAPVPPGPPGPPPDEQAQEQPEDPMPVNSPSAMPEDPAPLFPAGIPGDLGLSQRMTTLPCDGRYIVVVSSARTPATYKDRVSWLLSANKGTHYLQSPSVGCRSLRTTKEGDPIYWVYYGSYGKKSKACARKRSLSGKPYIKLLDNAVGPGHHIKCD